MERPLREELADHMREYQVEHAELITKTLHRVRADSCIHPRGRDRGSHRPPAASSNLLCLLRSCGRTTMGCKKTTTR